MCSLFFSVIPPGRSGSKGAAADGLWQPRRCAQRTFVRILRQIAIAANHLFTIHNANQPLGLACVPGNFHLIGTHSYLLPRFLCAFFLYPLSLSNAMAGALFFSWRLFLCTSALDFSALPPGSPCLSGLCLAHVQF